MEPIDLNPRYSTKDIPGKCIKCLAEQELNSCLRVLLTDEKDNKDVQQRFEMLVSFLKSHESKKLHDESERFLADGRQVTLRIRFEDEKLSYELEVD
ncbi:hypothetical protein ACFLW5_00310 [Chloroflexota bacterium]